MTREIEDLARELFIACFSAHVVRYEGPGEGSKSKVDIADEWVPKRRDIAMITAGRCIQGAEYFFDELNNVKGRNK